MCFCDAYQRRPTVLQVVAVQSKMQVRNAPNLSKLSFGTAVAHRACQPEPKGCNKRLQGSAHAQSCVACSNLQQHVSGDMTTLHCNMWANLCAGIPGQKKAQSHCLSRMGQVRLQRQTEGQQSHPSCLGCQKRQAAAACQREPQREALAGMDQPEAEMPRPAPGMRWLEGHQKC